ncbi:hypothetical protein [Paenibacillus sp. GM2FR]|nr:hypothetical protein [Paenibacillus sp. GM2FR]
MPAPGIHVWNGSFVILGELPRIQRLEPPGGYLAIPPKKSSPSVTS